MNKTPWQADTQEVDRLLEDLKDRDPEAYARGLKLVEARDRRLQALDLIYDLKRRQPSPGVADPELDAFIIEVTPEERDTLASLAEKGLRADTLVSAIEAGVADEDNWGAPLSEAVAGALKIWHQKDEVGELETSL